MNTDGKTHEAIREQILTGYQLATDEVAIPRVWLPDIIRLLRWFGLVRAHYLADKLEELLNARR